MKHDSTLERVHERLLTAELAVVLANQPSRATAVGQPLYVAAMVLLGAFVAVGMAWLARDDRASLQGGEFDAVDPWYEHEWPWRSMGGLSKPGRAAEAAEGVDEFMVTLRDEDSADLAAVLDRPAVRRLALSWRNDQAAPNVSPKLWQRITARPELEVLMLSGQFALPAERLRELRLAPELRYVILLGGVVALDVPTAQALVESTRLRAITLAMMDVTADGLATLAGLQDLEALLLSRPGADMRELIAAVPKLRNLRALVVESDAAIDATMLQPLAGMKRLRALDISFGRLDDAALGALPPQLELLALPSLDSCTAEGFGALRRLTNLRTLRLRGMRVSAPAQDALPAVLGNLPLERFDSLVASPDAATWQALQSLPKLRWLTLGRQGASLADVVAGSRACPHLEVLTLFEKQLPTPEELAPLRDHPTLRRIVFRIDEVPAATQDERLDGLRAAVRAQIEVMGR